MAGLTGTVKEHWIKTIQNKISIDDIEHLLSNEDYKNLKAIGNELNFWGDADNTLKVCEGIKKKSKVIFYGQKKHHTFASVPYVLINDKLSEYLWPIKKDGEKLYRNIYVVNNLQKINIPFQSHDYKKKDGKDYSIKADRFMSAGVLKDFDRFTDNDQTRGTIWYTSDALRHLDYGVSDDLGSTESDRHNKRALPRETPISKAWIYKISFTFNEIDMVYIGQDILCEDENKYLSSSLIFWHLRKMVGLLDATPLELKEKLNYRKQIIHEVFDTTKGHVNDLENEYIEKAYKEAKIYEEVGDKTFMPINYTGSNSPKYR